MLDYGFLTLLLLIVSIVVFNLGAIAAKVFYPKQNWSWALLAGGLIVESKILKVANGGMKKFFTGDIPNDDAFLLVIVTVVSIIAMVVVHKIGNKAKKEKEAEAA